MKKEKKENGDIKNQKSGNINQTTGKMIWKTQTTEKNVISNQTTEKM